MQIVGIGCSWSWGSCLMVFPLQEQGKPVSTGCGWILDCLFGRPT